MKKWTFILGIAVAACLLNSSSMHAAEISSNGSQKPKTQPYVVKNFDKLLGKIQGLNDDLLKMHFKLYQGYVNNTNTLLKKIQELDEKKENRTPDYAGLKRMLGWEFDGMLLHEYYFENLGGTEPLAKDDPLMKQIETDFGSFDKWKDDFTATGLIRGIGWVVTYVEPNQGRLINEWINEHDVGHLSGAKPLLVMDVFEHAYITQFGLERAKYIDIFHNNTDWFVVSKRFQEASAAK